MLRRRGSNELKDNFESLKYNLSWRRLNYSFDYIP